MSGTRGWGKAVRRQKPHWNGWKESYRRVSLKSTVESSALTRHQSPRTFAFGRFLLMEGIYAGDPKIFRVEGRHRQHTRSPSFTNDRQSHHRVEDNPSAGGDSAPKSSNGDRSSHSKAS